MTQEMQFKTIVAQYCEVKPDEMNNDMRFREDLGFSSLDFMSFTGDFIKVPERSYSISQ